MGGHWPGVFAILLATLDHHMMAPFKGASIVNRWSSSIEASQIGASQISKRGRSMVDIKSSFRLSHAVQLFLGILITRGDGQLKKT
jgi:hypothetical protein